jgi:DNA mismatch endonuclease (patch repair protein)
LTPASEQATRAARGSSRKRDTRPELLLRRAVFSRGLRYRCVAADLPGKPDLVFRRARVVVFVDGDFWHGRNLAARLMRLKRGHNAPYWVAKIEGNVARDQRTNERLRGAGWMVLRFWEHDIRTNVDAVAGSVLAAVRAALQFDSQASGPGTAS